MARPVGARGAERAPRPGPPGPEPATRLVMTLDMPRMACVEVVALLSINDE
ncbi:hypothetical protein KPATCC21470_4680 [Kitasatospora purpeofusca]